MRERHRQHDDAHVPLGGRGQRANARRRGVARVRAELVPATPALLHDFTGLPDVAGGRVLTGPIVSTIEEAVAALETHAACTMAGDQGSITLWRDDQERLRGAFTAWNAIKDLQVLESEAALRAWLTEWMKRLTGEV